MSYHFSLPSPSTAAPLAKPPTRCAPLMDAERDEILRSIPTLRRFAKSLTGDADRAEDLVQDALVRGLANIHTFRPGTNMQAWLMVILRNSFLSQLRGRRHENAYKALLYNEPASSHPNQFGTLQLRELSEALTHVPPDQRRALLLVFGYGYSYAEAASMCGCPTGTIKSRANRARVRLQELLQAYSAAEFTPDKDHLAVVVAGSVSHH